MSFRNIIALSDGAKLPQIGLGTYLPSKTHEVEFAVHHFYVYPLGDD